MNRKSVGYFEGTDSALLTALVCDGHDTIPVSNGRDNHGRHVMLLNDKNRVDLLVGYVHKIVPPDGDAARETSDVAFQDVFHLCRLYEIPLLIEIPTELHAKAARRLEDPPEIVRLVDPADMLTVARAILGG